MSGLDFIRLFDNEVSNVANRGIIHLVGTQNFPKNLHLGVRIRGQKMLVFRKILRRY